MTRPDYPAGRVFLCACSSSIALAAQFAFLLGLLLVATAFAEKAPPPTGDIPAEFGVVDPVALLRGRTPDDYRALRAGLTRAIWAGASPHLGATTEPFTHDLSNILGRLPQQIRWLNVPMDKGIGSRVIYAEFGASDCLMIYHAGHGAGFIVPPDLPYGADQYLSPGTKEFLRGVAQRGCDLLLVSMPFTGENWANSAITGRGKVTGWIHQDFSTLKPALGSAIRFFIDPVFSALDHALAVRPYARVGMSGLSGGGWTTVVVGALEPRISRLYSVAGSLPRYVLPPKDDDVRDWDQWSGNDVYRRVDNLDLYMMGVTEPARAALHLYNKHDPCCFKGALAGPFAHEISRYARENGFGRLGFFVDDEGRSHDLGPAIRAQIMADFFGTP